MKNLNDLHKELVSIDGRGYKAYKQLEGMYEFNDYILSIDHVQGDSFASPSKVRIIVDQNIAKIPGGLLDKKYKSIAVQDYITRLFYKNINIFSKKVFGSGKSGLISISKCPQEILNRTSIIIDEKSIQARIDVGFPARGRSVLAKELEKILFEFLPKIIEASLIYNNIDKNKLINQIKLVEDQEFIRTELNKKNLVAFVANGSILPRESGISTKPLKDGRAFYSPKTLEVKFDLPNRGEIKGMGIPKGITLIVGGGYHGKSTLLRGLELGVYNHIEGDGREFVITDDTALKVRAEDGRVIHNNDISLFINNLPNKKDTKKFFSENASGSTSQASNIIEGMESGTKTFLIDEDTSATNFMIRDEIMQKLVSREKEPITPFIEIVKSLYEQKGISTIIVVGSSGDYFDIADNVIQMDSYEAKDVTNEAKALSSGKILERIKEKNISIDVNLNRIVKNGSIENGYKGVKIKTLGMDGLSINKENIDLRAVEQIVDSEQVNAIGEIMKWAEDNIIDGKKTLIEITDSIMEYISKEGLLKINEIKGGHGNLAMPRRQEIMGAFNRFRNLVISK
ncbi:ABC-ATPase domain-containing protein [Clostridium uliginosum]|uniref:Predicted ATPase of the ABC class n=1 Tax=Clostridium uliginosum TaxID=119641 RepID=A0A1I1L7Z0_9CLOT|nr:ABC-ATPase domain-containing protein [Clostridium uliginosum]SFC69116.1 Predicted ATPase of the ABC class [Clostridium uliginosum]